LECNCLSFFFSENRDEPCRHINQVLKVSFDGDKINKYKAVELTAKGEKILRRRALRKQREEAAKNAA
jgi:hypothetical protein